MRNRCLGLAVFAAAGCNDLASPREPVVVSPESLQLATGDTAGLLVAGTAGSVQWKSAAPTIATVTSSGLVTAVARGETQIWAIRGADSGAARVRVTQRFCISDPAVAPSFVPLIAGETALVEARGTGCPPSSAFTWTTSDRSIATVTLTATEATRSIATVTARGEGNVVISASLVADPTVIGTVAVTVRKP